MSTEPSVKIESSVEGDAGLSSQVDYGELKTRQERVQLA